MSERVLFVDDEPNVLDGIQRSLRKQVDMRTASSGPEGLMLLRAVAEPFRVRVPTLFHRRQCRYTSENR
jgi:CheY-like chemotaxis protein